MGGGGSSERELIDDVLISPLVAPRQRTDVRYLWLVALAVVLQIATSALSVVSGHHVLHRQPPVNVEELPEVWTWPPEAFPDVHGNICGQSPQTRDMPFVYFCRDPSRPGVNIDFTWPICRHACPGTLRTEEEQRSSALCPREGNSSTAWVMMLLPVDDYSAESKSRGVLCLPVDHSMSGMFSQGVRGYAENRQKYLGPKVFLRLTLLVGCPVTLATLMALVYLHLLRTRYAQLFIVGCSTIAVLGPGVAGVRLFLLSMWAEPHSSFRTHGFLGSMVLLAVSAVFSCLSLFSQRSLRYALVCIQAACDCLEDVPALRSEPVIMAMVRMAVALLLLPGLQCVLGARNLSSLVRHILLAYWAGMFVWFMEFLSAASCFAVSFVTQAWYLSDPLGEEGHRNVPANVLKRGHLWGLRFHTGTFALSAFMMPLARVFRLCICPFGYCDNQAYLDVAMRSTSFFEAAQQAEHFMGHRSCLGGATGGSRAGGTFAAQLAGTGAITVLGATSTYFLLGDSLDTVPLVLISAAMSFLAVSPFMSLPDQVSDALVYCHSLDRDGHGARKRPWGTHQLLTLFPHSIHSDRIALS